MPKDLPAGNFPSVVPLFMGCLMVIGWVQTVHGSDELCRDVYQGIAKDVTSTTEIFVQQNDIFNRHCEKNGDIKSSSRKNAGSIVTDGLDFGFSGNSAQAASRLQEFCKAHRDNSLRSESFHRLKEQVVVDALRAYNECRALAKENVRVRVGGTESRTAFVRFDFDQKVNMKLERAIYDSARASCTANVGPGESQVDLLTLNSSVVVTKPFTVVCERTAVETEKGGQKFERLELLVDTLHGPFTLSLPTEEMAGYDLASEHRQVVEAQSAMLEDRRIEVAKLKAQIQSLQSNIAKRDARIAALGKTPTNNAHPDYKWHSVVQGEKRVPLPCPKHGYTIGAHTKKVCEKRKIIGPFVARAIYMDASRLPRAILGELGQIGCSSISGLLCRWIPAGPDGIR